MSKITMMSGLPASGKSTQAKEIIQTTGNSVRVNRDLLRTMLHFDKYSGNNESLTVMAEEALARAFLMIGINVVVDDCNLNPRNLARWKHIAKEENAKFEHVMCGTGVFECLQRDLNREKSVGINVINNMALQWGKIEAPEKGWVLCDIDGTIADCEHRLHYIKGEKKDWKGFFSEVHNDKLIESTKEKLLKFHEEGYGIIFLSARNEDCRKETVKWLSDNGLDFYSNLLMRKSHDHRPDTDVKRDILNTYFKDRSKIHLVIDDRPVVIRMWREEGLNVLDVGKGIEF